MKKAENTLGKAVLFSIGPEIWATELGRIKEIVRAPQIESLPNAKPGIAGIINVRGEIVPVISKGSQEDSGETKDRDSFNILLIHWNDQTVGLAIDHVHGIEDIVEYHEDEEDYEEKDALPEGAKGVATLATSGTVPLVDIEMIMEPLKSGKPDGPRPGTAESAVQDGA